MIRNLLATTALVTLLTGAAYAQDTNATTTAPAATAPADGMATKPVSSKGYLASNLIGETVYNGTGDNAEKIGDVNDVVIGANGSVDSIIIGVGGFLGIAEKDVAFNYKDIDWAERDGDRWIVVNATKDQLQAQTEFDRTPYDPAPAAMATAPAADTNAVAPADTNAMAPADNAMAPADTAKAPAPAEAAQAPAATTTDTTTTAAIDKSTLKEMPAGDIRAEDLVGTTVYGASDANLGEIGDVVLTQDGKTDAVIMDVGGFLGMGEKEVAVGMDKLQFMTDADGNKYLYTTFTKEQLDAAAAYDKSTWADNRDAQRLTVQ